MAVPPTSFSVVRGSVAATALLEDDGVDALAVALAPAGEGDDGAQPRAGATDAAVRYGIDLPDLADRHDATGAAGEVRTVHLPRALAGGGALPWAGLPSRLLLVGIGSGGPEDLRRSGAALARATQGLRRVVTTVGSDAGPDGVRALVEGFVLGAYRHPSRATAPSPPAPPAEVVLLGRHAEAAVTAAVTAAHATCTARALTVEPSDTKTPAWLADRAVALARAAGLETEVLDEDALRAGGFGGVLAVGGGSASPPRLVTVRYTPAETSRTARHVVVVGKGITYDTGGISIKPRESMVAMKTDMAGAAVALATVLGAAAAGVRHRVTAVLPLAENAVGASAYRPGDVLRLYDGTTVEIGNTDAEGRIVLADALAYADARLEPDVLVDVATLTGAATLGLGRQHGALYTSDDRLARGLEAAGLEAGERLWRMPLVPEYAEAIRSQVADVRQVPVDGWTGGGSITAALFLQRFAGARRWAHLDIAGPARATAAAHEVPEGATGFGVRVLMRWLGQLR
ncbi:leucyl aminopeptidase family protein [Cellulomonas sp. APG4]|nr:leucyl aminopeptidase family protein [Cellulomonas sp. APG4]